ncbi:MAG: DMT family transporter [Rhodospirillales bacterium]|nr:DMT family transporter [Rhodospirillales bacterium]MDP6883634.1 DMT family transporter [Rhodospirillales bacterium]
MKRHPSIVEAWFGGQPSTLRGMIFMLVAGFFGTVMAASVRNLTSDLHPFEIAFFRALFGCVFLSPLVIRQGLGLLKSRRMGLQALRGCLQGAATMIFFTALSLAPLAKVAALNFSAPLFATVLAIVVLGEAVRLRRITALAVGFAGTMVIVRPGFGGLDLGSMLILINAATLATTTILIKILLRSDTSLTTTIHGFLFTLPITAVASLFVWQTPSWPDMAWLVAIGVFGGLTHLFFAKALDDAEVTAVLPMGFAKLIWASVIGYLIFAETPDAWTWVGGAMIFSATTYIAFRERSLKSLADGRP